MNTWKQASSLAWFELRKSKMSLLYFAIMLLASTILFVSMLSSYLQKSFVGMDVFFLIAFGFSPVWMKPKEFQYQKIDERTWGSPLFITLSQLPIKKEVLAGSRFIVYFTYAIPFQILLLISLYVFSSDIRVTMSPAAYFIFSVIWMAYGICVGGAFPAVDAGDHITLQKSIVQAILLFFALMIMLVIFHIAFGFGLVAWTIILAKEWPLVSTVVSIITAIIGYRYYVNYAYKKMAKIDYLK